MSYTSSVSYLNFGKTTGYSIHINEGKVALGEVGSMVARCRAFSIQASMVEVTCHWLRPFTVWLTKCHCPTNLLRVINK